jgi:hypothetical protein
MEFQTYIRAGCNLVLVLEGASLMTVLRSTISSSFYGLVFSEAACSDVYCQALLCTAIVYAPSILFSRCSVTSSHSQHVPSARQLGDIACYPRKVTSAYSPSLQLNNLHHMRLLAASSIRWLVFNLACSIERPGSWGVLHLAINLLRNGIVGNTSVLRA